MRRQKSRGKGVWQRKPQEYDVWIWGRWLEPTHPWETQTEALGEACPLEEVQDEAFQVVVGVVAAPQILEAQHGDVLGHEGHGGPAASETFLWEQIHRERAKKTEWKQSGDRSDIRKSMENKAGKSFLYPWTHSNNTNQPTTRSIPHPPHLLLPRFRHCNSAAEVYKKLSDSTDRTWESSRDTVSAKIYF